MGSTVTVMVDKVCEDMCRSAMEGAKPWGVSWNNNWDDRDPKSLVKPSDQTGKIDPEEIAQKTPKGYRYLFLIRHGQYEKEGEKGLTALGKEQAIITSKRLNDLGYPYSGKIIASNLLKSMETAKIIAEHSRASNDQDVVAESLLNDGVAVEPLPPLVQWFSEDESEMVLVPEVNELMTNIVKDGPRLEEAYRKYFHRINYEDNRDSFEIMVCHSNVIRYFICRALQLPPEAWQRFTLRNCSITNFLIWPNGQVSVLKIGECGHIPSDKLTEM